MIGQTPLNGQKQQAMNPNMLAGVEVPVNNFTKRALKRNAANQNLQGSLGEKKQQKVSQVETEIPNCQAHYKRIDGQLFIDGCATKFDLRHFNVLAVKDIQIVFVSTFQELYGAPFLSIHPQFRGKIYMTQPLAQIGQNLLYEFVRLNRKRNAQKAQQISFFEQE